MKGKFTKGFKGVRDIVSEKGKYVANCNSCVCFYQGGEDAEECCHNNEVTKYDMCYDTNKTYCSFWNCERNKEKKRKDDF